MPDAARRTIVSDLGYLEAARWHDGALWFSEMKHRRVHRWTPESGLETVVDVPTRPSGLGFAPDGSLLVVSQEDQRLLRLAPGATTTEDAGDLSTVGIHPNDMAVDAEGRAYISHFGFDWFAGEELRETGLIVREPDGRVALQGGGLGFPNGVVLSPDGRRLYVSESFSSPVTRLSVFDVGPDGALGERRTVREFGPPDTHVVDGICVDAQEGVWVSLCLQGEFRRVLPDGTVTDVIAIPPEGGDYVVDSVLGGPDGTTLFLLIADATVERINAGFQTTARVDAVEVAVPGPGGAAA
ncbi:SMP-30/gluconolactonase/LRE family protein [Patulibacter brassicae]|uniref:SMP-30/gluconolactonase/LRE family protein n=1 Tax=Patulibacter brassicae TaxID=1705717 RepID=A0ABU4VPL6_9ACTN|nr:SMP-30/gluconolactonase/LRE family protein [Patulibacter brassicae]MDX8152705.1 SMP-30/gluconolactonase/LRE family protein [Patulibacter brassicae]